MNEANLEKIERGRNAVLVEALVAPIIEDHINNCVSELVRMYRGGEIEHDLMVGRIAEIAAMQTLINELETRQRLGEIAAQKEFNSGV